MFTPLFVDHVLAPGFNSHDRQLTLSLTRIMLAQPLILVIPQIDGRGIVPRYEVTVRASDNK